MISDAAMKSKRVCRSGLVFAPPAPATTLRSARSDASVTLDQLMPAGCMPQAAFRYTAFSTSAARRLWAEPTACASPVKWMLISSSGTTVARPPPVPPPLMPKIGPSDGSRSVTATLRPSTPKPCVSPTAVVVFPSPAGVGVMPVTTTSFPPRSDGARMASSAILAL